jgi:hypothetical protein
MKSFSAFAACLAIATFQSSSVMAADPDFYGAALCDPPYSMDSAMAVYEAPEKLAKPDTSSLGAAIYKLPHQIGRDGFESDEVMVSGSAVGVLIAGQRADELAAKYELKRETSDLFGTSTNGYSRELTKDQPSGLAGAVRIFIIAREGAGLPGKTLLACESVIE